MSHLEKTASSFVLLMSISLASACGGEQTDPKVPSTTTTTTNTVPAAEKTTILSFVKSADSMKVDKVGGSDGALKPDGNMDAAYAAEIDGPVSALFILSADASGTPNGEYDADTLVGAQDLPKELGVTLKGHNTAGLGVFDGDKLVSNADGSITLGAGKHKLALYFANTGVVTPGASVVLYAQAPDKSVAKGPVAPF